MRFQFQLRTLFIVIAAVAISLGSNLAIQNLRGFKPPAGEWYGLAFSIMLWGSVPQTVVCMLGMDCVVRKPHIHTSTRGMVLVALLVNLAWLILGGLAIDYLAKSLSSDLSENFFYMSLGSLVSSVINATCWLLMILAFLRASDMKKQ